MNASPQPADIDNRWLALALGGLLAVVCVFHIGAWLGATISGATFHASLSDSGVALLHLPSHMGRPLAAWTPVMRGNVFAFWTSEVLVIGLVAVTIAIALRFRSKHSSDSFGIKRNAGLARRHDLRGLRIDAPMPGRITLGRVGRDLIAAEAQASLAVVGPTGCGKTVGFAIPALLEWQGPIIATSVKADLIAATVEHRRSRGKVWIYDPTGCSGEAPSSWSPLAACRDWQGAQRVAAWLCEAAQPKLDTVSDGDYWYTQARKALAPYLFAAATTNKTMADVVSWIDRQEQTEVEAALRSAASLDDEVDRVMASPDGQRLRSAKRVELEGDVLDAMRTYLVSAKGDIAQYADKPVSQWPTMLCTWLAERLNAHADAAARPEIELDLMSSMRDRVAPLVAAQAVWAKDGRIRDSVSATVENVLTGYGDPVIGAAPMTGGIDFDEWLSGDNTIYVVATSHEQARLRPVLTIAVQQAIRSAFDKAMTSGGTLIDPCLVLLDEAGNVAPLRDLPAYASTARSHGISLVTVWQDLAQIKAIYHDRAQTVLNNHRAKLFGTGIADDQTLEYISRLVGEVPETQQNHSRDLTGDRRSVSEHTAYRRAAPVDVLRRIKTNEAVLLYGSELPAHVRLRPWFSDQSLRALASKPAATKEPR